MTAGDGWILTKANRLDLTIPKLARFGRCTRVALFDKLFWGLILLAVMAFPAGEFPLLATQAGWAPPPGHTQLPIWPGAVQSCVTQARCAGPKGLPNSTGANSL